MLQQWWCATKDSFHSVQYHSALQRQSLLIAVMDRSNNAKQIKTSPDISNLQGNANAVRSRSAFPTCELSSPPAATWAPPSARPPATPSGRRTARASTRRAGRRTASAAATSVPPSSPSVLRSPPADSTARDKGDFTPPSYHGDCLQLFLLRFGSGECFGWSCKCQSNSDKDPTIPPEFEDIAANVE